MLRARLACCLGLIGAACAEPARYEPPAADGPTDAGMMQPDLVRDRESDSDSLGGRVDGQDAPEWDANVTPPDAGDGLPPTPDQGDMMTPSSSCITGGEPTCGTPNKMFVTSLTFASDLGGLEGADAKCAERTRAAALGGSYIALLSTSTVPAFSRLGSASGWIRVDGRPFANSQKDLIEGRISYPPMLDEFGKTVTSPHVWSGTEYGGMPAPQGTGNDWRAPMGASCNAGDAFNGEHRWYEYYSAPCTYEARLYCFERSRVSTVVIPRPAPGARLAFLSRSAFDTSSGLDGADTLCSNEARAAGLQGGFRALLPTTMITPTDRFDLSGSPWFRTDGVQLVVAAQDLAQGRLMAPLMKDAQARRDVNAVRVWTGSAAPSSPGSVNCSNWATRNSMVKGLTGSPAWTNNWYSTFQAPCDASDGHVYCLQQ
jgi:hypothetical protein